MRILYDSQIFSWQRHGGISRYFCELTYWIRKIPGTCVLFPRFAAENVYLKDQNFIRYFDTSRLPRFRGKRRLAHSLNKAAGLYKIVFDSFDVFHPTYYDTYFLPWVKEKPMVVTVYDMIHELYPQYSTISRKISTDKFNIVTRSTKVIAISENTKRDLIKIFGIPEEKISVIPLASAFHTVKSMPTSIPSKYLLYVGVRSGYKNFIPLLESIAGLLGKEKISLYCVGGGGFTAEELNSISKLHLNGLLLQHEVDDRELKFLYEHALAFVAPSLYEGFGVPLIEALQSGCPVVLSNASSHPEITKDAGTYFDPHDKESMLRAVEAMIFNPSKRDEAMHRGREVGKEFSWEKTAMLTHEVYKSLI